jgi:2-polyprenyl-6-hydroxyphenyl methylase/3-demethylubiquinone-9 3-methyltransferase
MSEHALLVKEGKRFEFGANWASFLSVLDDERIEQAKISLKRMLGDIDLAGKTFIDIGSGSGLFSLAARMLGAKVHSFDFDPQSVACTAQLRQQYFAGDPDWVVEEGSALDPGYLSRLGQFDIVYSWGVLHHTGEMWQALGNVVSLLKEGGTLFISIYNDQGRISRGWTAVKKVYCGSSAGQLAVKCIFYPYFAALRLGSDFIHRRNPLTSYDAYKSDRGMSVVYSWKDWLGGYPFEVATPDEILQFFRARQFTLIKLKTVGGTMGCNEFVFSLGR